MHQPDHSRYVYKTTYNSLATLYYWRLNGTNVTEQQFFDIVKHNAFKAKNTKIRKRIASLLSRGFIHIVDNGIFLTDKGLWHIEQKEKTIQAIMYGHVLKHGHVSRKELNKMYLTFAYRVTRDPRPTNRTLLILKRLRREGGLDYTDDEVWCTKEVKIIGKEE